MHVNVNYWSKLGVLHGSNFPETINDNYESSELGRPISFLAMCVGEQTNFLIGNASGFQLQNKVMFTFIQLLIDNSGYFWTHGISKVKSYSLFLNYRQKIPNFKQFS